MSNKVELPPEAREAARRVFTRLQLIVNVEDSVPLLMELAEIIARAYQRKEAELQKLRDTVGIQAIGLAYDRQKLDPALKLADELMREQLALCDCGYVGGVKTQCTRCDKARRYQEARKGEK